MLERLNRTESFQGIPQRAENSILTTSVPAGSSVRRILPLLGVGLLRFTVFALLIGAILLTELGNLAQSLAVEVPLSANTTQGTGKAFPKKYVPPMIGNGSISLAIDWTGSQYQKAYSGIWRAGRRYSAGEKFTLIPFGWFEQKIAIDGKNVDSFEKWSQTLDVENGVVINSGLTPEIEQIMTVIVPFDKDLIGIQRKVTNKSNKAKKVRLEFYWHLCAPGTTRGLPNRLQGKWNIDPATGTAFFDYTVYGLHTSNGRLAAFSDSKGQITFKDETAVLSREISLAPGQSQSVAFYLLTRDSIDDAKFSEQLVGQIKQTQAANFDSLLKAHQKDWRDFYGQSDVDLPELAIQRIYNTGQYHLRINATRWSFPVGISPRLWHGRYFGWDEMFCHQGLLTCNHLELAQRCPDFRKSCLKTAVFRIAHYGREGKFGARYVWETLEDGSEGSPSGFWFDHIFHMSNIARSAWTQYLYSDNLAWLKSTGFPVILECARYYRSHWVYEDSNGEMYLGKCTDLERLGPAKDHPFMTTCGAIYSMRAAAQAAELLKTNLDEAADFRKVADKLVESLPHRNGAYIAYPNCQEHSVATLGGLFPYDIFDNSNPLQKKAAYTYIRDGRANGNMYPVGNSVCPWFAGWMAAAMALLEDRDEPVRLIREAAGTAGDFGELFEINEEKVSMKPWFSTAAGNCVYGVNQMLIHGNGSEIRLAPGVPDSWKNYSFRLPAPGGITVKMTVKNGRLINLQLDPIHADRERSLTLTIPKSLLQGVKINPDFKYKTQNGVARLTVTFKNSVDIF